MTKTNDAYKSGPSWPEACLTDDASGVEDKNICLKSPPSSTHARRCVLGEAPLGKNNCRMRLPTVRVREPPIAIPNHLPVARHVIFPLAFVLYFSARIGLGALTVHLVVLPFSLIDTPIRPGKSATAVHATSLEVAHVEADVVAL